MPLDSHCLRFGLIVHDAAIARWQREVVDHLESVGAHLAVIVLAPRPNSHSRSLWHYYWAHIVERRSVALETVQLPLRYLRTPVVLYPNTWSGDGPGERALAEHVATFDLDFLLQVGGEAVGPAMFQAAKHGLWTFLQDHEQRVHGKPPFFWEIGHRSQVTLASLVKLTGYGHFTLYSGAFKTLNNSYVRSLDSALLGCTDWPARVCKDILHGSAAHAVDPGPYTPGTLRQPSAPRLIFMLIRGAAAHARSLLLFLFREDEWHIGLTQAPIETYVYEKSPVMVKWLPNPPHERYYADPFGTIVGDQLVILAEDYDIASGKGIIAAVVCSRDGVVLDRVSALRTGTHLSYPYLVCHENGIYCIPEACESMGVPLYQAVEFPGTWKQVGTLLHDVSLADPTIFTHEGIWWLFGTVARKPEPSERRGVVDTYTKLCAWYADSITGPWTPHPANPLKTDIRSSRPAGTPFVHRGQLYRPAQDNSSDYGGGVVINHITKLTKVEFAETPVNVLTPSPNWSYQDGLHTLTHVQGGTLIDAKHTVTSTRGLKRRLSKAGREILHRLR